MKRTSKARRACRRSVRSSSTALGIKKLRLSPHSHPGHTPCEPIFNVPPSCGKYRPADGYAPAACSKGATMRDRIIIPFGHYDRIVRLAFDLLIGGLVYYAFR